MAPVNHRCSRSLITGGRARFEKPAEQRGCAVLGCGPMSSADSVWGDVCQLIGGGSSRAELSTCWILAATCPDREPNWRPPGAWLMHNQLSHRLDGAPTSDCAPHRGTGHPQRLLLSSQEGVAFVRCGVQGRGEGLPLIASSTPPPLLGGPRASTHEVCADFL
uniref:Uncharacterized protein n=1 Tax=Myotis myotis TaxID=51298 RepID=A0A7J7V3F5_MYOMY|nr:hypothetical protein mMyoMyo1_008429 [Myotis myotis]